MWICISMFIHLIKYLFHAYYVLGIRWRHKGKKDTIWLHGARYQCGRMNVLKRIRAWSKPALIKIYMTIDLLTSRERNGAGYLLKGGKKSVPNIQVQDCSVEKKRKDTQGRRRKERMSDERTALCQGMRVNRVWGLPWRTVWLLTSRDIHLKYMHAYCCLSPSKCG